MKKPPAILFANAERECYDVNGKLHNARSLIVEQYRWGMWHKLENVIECDVAEGYALIGEWDSDCFATGASFKQTRMSGFFRITDPCSL